MKEILHVNKKVLQTFKNNKPQSRKNYTTNKEITGHTVIFYEVRLQYGPNFTTQGLKLKSFSKFSLRKFHIFSVTHFSKTKQKLKWQIQRRSILN